jgi:hypothetical protein
VRSPTFTLAAVLSAACSRTPAPAASQTAGSAPAAVPLHASASSSGATTAAAPALPDGCWSGLALDVDAAAAPLARLQALAERCADGLASLEPEPVVLEVGVEPRRHEFEVESATGCVRILASGGAAVADLQLALADAKGKSLHEDSLRGPFAVAPTFGTACLEPGKYAALVRVAQGSATVALGAYAAK